MRKEYIKHSLGQKINIAWGYDDSNIEIDFGDDTENKDYIRRFLSGELLSVLILVTYRDDSGNVYGEDILGDCHVSSKDFARDILSMVSDHGMVDNAKADMIRIVREIKRANSWVDL
jgi:hypothetical protein